MALNYYPSAGEILLCHYDKIVVEPEMCKPRPVVVIGPRLRCRSRLVTVVPLSTTEPDVVQAYQVRLEITQPLPRPFDKTIMWAKCDMVTSVSLARLDRFKEPYHGRVGRKWRTGHVTAEDLRQIRVGVLCGLGFGGLTKHL